MYLTKRQREVFEYINKFIQGHRYSPSLREIAQGTGISSLATIHKHLRNLEGKGVIRRIANRGRALEVTPELDAPRAVEMSLACFALPILGIVQAGQPIEAIQEDEAERMSVPVDFVRDSQKTFVLRVRGDSMIDDGIHDGDFIICERRADANNGQVVVALVRGYETTVKRFYREKTMVRLQPANPYMAPLVLPAREVEVQGVVVGLLRKY